MLRIGLIGAGNMGSKHARILRTMHEEGKCKFTACCDLVKNRAESALGDIEGKKYTNFEEMLEKESLDGIIIATPTAEHMKMSLRAIEKGINVLVEKPVTIEIEGSRKIYEESKKAGVIVEAGMVEVFNSVVTNLVEMVRKRKLTLNTAIFNRFGFKTQKNDSKDMDVIHDLMIHDIAVALELLEYPELTLIGARALNLNEKSGFHDSASAFLTDGKSNILFNASRSSEIKVRSFSMDFKELYVQGNYMDQKLNIFSSSKFEFTEAANNLWYNMAFDHTLARYSNNPLYDEDLDFISAIESSREPKIGSDKWLLIMEVIDEIESQLFQ